MELQISAALQVLFGQAQKSDIAISLVKWIYLNILPLNLISVWADLLARLNPAHLFLRTTTIPQRKMLLPVALPLFPLAPQKPLIP